MKKALVIAWKDLQVTFRDRAALILMLAAPFALTLAMGFVTGSFNRSSGSSGLADIPVVLVNQDQGELGTALVEALASEDLADLLEPTFMDDLSAARDLVEEDQTAAVVWIPAGFSASILPDPQSGITGEPVVIELYANPARPISAGVIESVVDGFLAQLEVGLVGGQVAVTQMVAHGWIPPEQAPLVGQSVGMQIAQDLDAGQRIALRSETEVHEAEAFNPLAYLAPSMALLFLMYTVSNGGRSILAERDEGTLPRVLVSPTSAAQVLGGKVSGIFLAGFAQVGVLVLGSSLLFGLNWGDPIAVVALVGAAVIGASGWGILLAALARTPGQVSGLGMALMLTFGVLGGSFFQMTNAPTWLQWLSRITPNAWGMDGFTWLASGGTLADILPDVLALLVMGLVLFAAAVVWFRRRGLVRR